MKIRRVSTIIILISLSQFIYAATISGKVTGASSGDFLPGANVCWTEPILEHLQIDQGTLI